MDLRDEIAVAVLPAVYANYWRDVATAETSCDEHWREGLAMEAYDLADAMIAVRSAKVTPNAVSTSK